MADTVKQAFWYKLKFWNKKAAQKLSNPELEGEINIDDAKAELAKFQSKVRDLIAADLGIERELNIAKTEFANLDSTARKITTKLEATDSSDEKYSTYQTDQKQTAILAVSAKQKIESLERTSKNNKETITKLEAKITEYENMISDSQNKFTQLKARSMSAKISQEIADAESGLADGQSAIGKLTEFEKIVQEQEDKAAASEQINATSARGTAAKLIEEYGTGGKSAEVDDYINSLSTTPTTK